MASYDQAIKQVGDCSWWYRVWISWEKSVFEEDSDVDRELE